jgi:hypothetical protein
VRTVTYISADAPRASAALALLLEPKHGYLPIRFTASTVEEAKTKAETWWAEELARARGRLMRTAPGKPAKPEPAAEAVTVEAVGRHHPDNFTPADAAGQASEPEGDHMRSPVAKPDAGALGSEETSAHPSPDDIEDLL